MDAPVLLCHSQVMRSSAVRLVSRLIFFACIYLAIWFLPSPRPQHVSAAWVAVGIALMTAVFLLGFVVHELGHAVAARIVGSQVIAVHVFGPPARLTFRVGGVPVAWASGFAAEYCIDRCPPGAMLLSRRQVRPRTC